jgi:hypothetical protein
MRLIGISNLIDGVEDRYALSQKNCGLAGAFDLTDSAMRQPGGP